jgi:Ca-activated chloride channel family protein
MSQSVMENGRSNLDVGKEVIRGFVGARGQDRMGLISFARFPKLVCPLTTDGSALTRFIEDQACESQGSALDGTAIGAALAEAAWRFSTAYPGEQRDRVVILLTDGEENQHRVDPLVAAKLCKEERIRVYPVAAAGLTAREGLDAEGSDPSLRLHKEIAALTGGQAQKAEQAADLERVYQKIDRLEKKPLESRYYSFVHDLYRWPLLFAALLLCLEFLLARTLCLRIP